MKRFIVINSIVLLLVTISGCNVNDHVAEVPENKPMQVKNKMKQEEIGETVEVTFNFMNFDLDVDYRKNQSFNVDYENEQDGMEARLKDDRANINLNGDEALTELRHLFEQLSFDKETSNEEVISQVIQVFKLDKDFQHFELEVEFIDGVVKEYQKRQ